MRAKIRAEKVEGGYTMVAILPWTDKVEYPQEGRVHAKKADVYRDAAIMYSDRVWEYNPRNHTISPDDPL